MIYLATLATLALSAFAIKLELESIKTRKLMKRAKSLAIYTDADGKDRSVKFACENSISTKDAEYMIYSQTGQLR